MTGTLAAARAVLMIQTMRWLGPADPVTRANISGDRRPPSRSPEEETNLPVRGCDRMARTQRLKVFRTPIGFHDAYIAAPSRKAALKAWGSDADLFARGVAEEVTDVALMRAPLDRPGEVIKLARGSAAEHLAAAGAERSKPKRAKTGPVTAGGGAIQRQPRPSRKALDEAEEALEKLQTGHRRTAEGLRSRADDLKRQLAAIEVEQRAIDAAHEMQRKSAQAAVDRERKHHSAALDKWLSAQD